MRYSTYRIDAYSVKNAINPHDFYLREQDLYRYNSRSGEWAIAGLCPFHKDSKAGSFKVNLTTGAFRCWSCQKSGGDIIAFVIEKYNLSFKEALEWLAKEGNLR